MSLPEHEDKMFPMFETEAQENFKHFSLDLSGPQT